MQDGKAIQHAHCPCGATRERGHDDRCVWGSLCVCGDNPCRRVRRCGTGLDDIGKDGKTSPARAVLPPDPGGLNRALDRAAAEHLRAVAPHVAGSPRDWLEDRAHENGNYWNECCICHGMFIGHKRRVTCRACHRDVKPENAPAPPQPEPRTCHCGAYTASECECRKRAPNAPPQLERDELGRLCVNGQPHRPADPRMLGAPFCVVCYHPLAPAPPAEAKHHEEDCVCRECRPEMHSAQPPAEAKGEEMTAVGLRIALDAFYRQGYYAGMADMSGNREMVQEHADRAEVAVKPVLDAFAALRTRAREAEERAEMYVRIHRQEVMDGVARLTAAFRERDEAREQRDAISDQREDLSNEILVERAARVAAEAQREAYRQDRDLTAHRLAAAEAEVATLKAEREAYVTAFVTDKPVLARENAALREEVKRLRIAYDDPSLDATDGAHPAWWRGNDAGVAGAVRIVNEALDGPLPLAGCVGGADLEAVRQRVAALRASVARLVEAGDEARDILNAILDNQYTYRERVDAVDRWVARWAAAKAGRALDVPAGSEAKR